MSVIYYDVLNLMALGTAKQMPTLSALLNDADFVTCHVPELPETKNMIGAAQFEQMKQGSYLINASRSGKIAGAALDVYPSEPGGNGDYFTNELNPWAEDLRSLKNIILTPHIGGSTEEAQRAIGVEGKSYRYNLETKILKVVQLGRPWSDTSILESLSVLSTCPRSTFVPSQWTSLTTPE
jgi:D-3-phosphoglycerate dehydrogenase